MILQVLHSMTIFLIKLSWLALLHRIFPTEWLLHATRAIGSLITAYTVVHYVPIRALWNLKVVH